MNLKLKNGTESMTTAKYEVLNALELKKQLFSGNNEPLMGGGGSLLRGILTSGRDFSLSPK